jgi:hypothetical protein
MHFSLAFCQLELYEIRDEVFLDHAALFFFALTNINSEDTPAQTYR